MYIAWSTSCHECTIATTIGTSCCFSITFCLYLMFVFVWGEWKWGFHAGDKIQPFIAHKKLWPFTSPHITTGKNIVLLYRVARKKTEQSIQSIFQDFSLINSYLVSP